MARLFLASASTTRARMLAAAGVPFQAMAATINEENTKKSLIAENCDAAAIAIRLAELKALNVSGAYPQDFVLGCDQILSFGDMIVSKCENLVEAELLLRRLRGQAHHLQRDVDRSAQGALNRGFSHRLLFVRASCELVRGDDPIVGDPVRIDRLGQLVSGLCQRADGGSERLPILIRSRPRLRQSGHHRQQRGADRRRQRRGRSAARGRVRRTELGEEIADRSVDQRHRMYLPGTR